MLDTSLAYQNEFLGCRLGAVTWVTSDKALLNLTMALSNQRAGCVSSEMVYGKSEIIDVSVM